LVELGHGLLGLQVGVEGDQLLAHLRDHGDLLLQQGVEAGNVLLDVGAWLVHLVEQRHLLLDKVNDVVDVPSVAGDDLLFLLEDLFDEFLMLRAKLVRVILILLLQVLHGGHRIVEVHLLIVVLWLGLRRGCLLLRNGSLRSLQRLLVDERLARDLLLRNLPQLLGLLQVLGLGPLQRVLLILHRDLQPRLLHELLLLSHRSHLRGLIRHLLELGGLFQPLSELHLLLVVG